MTQLVAINVLAQVAPLLCVLSAFQLGRFAPLLLEALRRLRARLRYMPARASAQYKMDDSP
jgi:hypothetical protein